MDRRLVDHLVNAELVSRAEMQRAILRAKKNKVGVLDQLLNLDSLDEALLAAAVAKCYGLDVLDTSDGFDANPDAYNLISKSLAKKHGVLPFDLDGDTVQLLAFSIESVEEVADTLKTATGKDPKVFIAPTMSFLTDAIAHFYDAKAWPDKPAAPESVPLELEDVVVPESSVHKKPVVIDEPAVHRKTTRRVEAPKPKAPAPAPKPAKARPEAAPPKAKEDDVEAALQDFDAFLDSSDFLSGAPGVSAADPLADQWAQNQEKESGFDLSGWDDIDDDDMPAVPDEGFDLFEPSEADLTIADVVERQQRAIAKLHDELKAQREVVSSLVELLVEARVINRKELTKRVKAKRK